MSSVNGDTLPGSHSTTTGVGSMIAETGGERVMNSLSPALRTALGLHARGFWPVAIYPKGHAIGRDRIATGKEPMGAAWGLARWDTDKIRREFDRVSGAGVGVGLGPGRGPEGAWLIDLEGDGLEAADSLSMFLGGELIESVGWTSTRGSHALFTADGERLLAALTAAGAREQTGRNKPGVWHLDELPALEIRVGGAKQDGAIKQVQSVCPPTVGDNGEPREWSGADTLLALPEAAYAFLGSIAATRRPAAEMKSGNGNATSTGTSAYAAAALRSEVDQLSKLGEGGRHHFMIGACIRLAGLVKAGELTAFECTEGLKAAYMANGAGRGRFHQIDDAWGSGYAIAEARTIPERPQAATSANGNGRHATAITGPANSAAKNLTSFALPSSGEKLNLTELGNAKRMVRQFGDVIRYCYPWRSWLIWDGMRWLKDDSGEINRLAKRTVQAIGSEAAACNDKDERADLLSWALRSEQKKAIEAMVALAQSEEGIPVRPEALDRDGWLFNVQNGTIDLRTGKLKPADRADYITKVCPVVYDESAKCPLWDQTLDLFLGESGGLISYFQSLCGYAMVGEIHDHIMPICHGSGQNGKSTILGTLIEVFGPDYAIKCAPDLLMAKGFDTHPTDRADLYGKRLVLASETEENRRLNETMVKELTGGDRIRARRMREDFWEFSPTHTVIMATNHKPVVYGTDHAIWRRLKLVPFNVTVEGNDADKSMPQKLKEERAGILAWCLRGASQWRQYGLVEPVEVTDATAEYRSEEDILGRFLSEYAIIGPSLRVKIGAFYDVYKAWAEDSCKNTMTKITLGKRLKEKGVGEAHSGAKWYTGIALREDY